MSRLARVALILSMVPLASATEAHHAVNAQFNMDQQMPLVGVLTRLDDLNPHAYWHFDVMGPNGQVQKWNVESLAPGGLRRAGVRLKEDIKIGQTYPIRVATSRNGSTTGLLLGITINGKEYPLTPS